MWCVLLVDTLRLVAGKGVAFGCTSSFILWVSRVLVLLSWSMVVYRVPSVRRLMSLTYRASRQNVAPGNAELKWRALLCTSALSPRRNI